MAAAQDPRSSVAVLEQIAAEGGLGLMVRPLDDASPAAVGPASGAVRLGLHRRGALPTRGLDAFDILLSCDPDAPAPWVGFAPAALDAAVERLGEAVNRQPIAATVAAQVLRVSLQVPFSDALAMESLGYSMLLASGGFEAWRAATPVRRRSGGSSDRVALSREGGGLVVRLNRPEARNAVDARMRDELVEALRFAAIDPDAAPVVLCGEGPSFSAGGDLDEFGQAEDPGLAHAIRVLRSAARLVYDMRERVTARLHGACIGAGIEIPTAAGRVVARPDAVFRLPEVSMGLIPGAGGVASIPRRIGRHRACYMAVSGADVDARTALAWGLVDSLDPGS